MPTKDPYVFEEASISLPLLEEMQISNHDLFTYMQQINNLELDSNYPTLQIDRIFMNEAKSSSAPIAFPQTKVSGVPTFGPPVVTPWPITQIPFGQPNRVSTAIPYLYDHLPTSPSTNAQIGSMLTLPKFSTWEETIRRLGDQRSWSTDPVEQLKR